MSARLVMALSSVGLVVAAAVLSYFDGMFLPSQMMQRYPVGFPFIANGGMWGDLIFVSAALYVIGKYASAWTGPQVLMMLIAGCTMSAMMHYFVYLQGSYPDSLAGGGRPLSPAGWVHVLYFGLAMAAILLFYFCSHPAKEDVIVVGILLALHIVIANHVPLNFLNERLFFPWCPAIFEKEASSLRIVGIALALLAGVTAMKFKL